METVKINHPYLTAIKRSALSVPVRYLLKYNLLRGCILDFGCGFGYDTDELKSQGYDITGYDIYYRPEYPTKKFDTIICIYVLNVLEPYAQAEVMADIENLLAPNGTVYFAVRRDLTVEGFRMHAIHKQYTYQCNVRLPYRSLTCNKSFELYQYKKSTEYMTRRIFVTGGAHGIGKSIMEAFAGRGDKVAFCDIDALRGEVVAAQTGAAFYKVDVTDAEQLEATMQHVFDAWGDIDVLVNNVGIGMFKPLTEVSVEEFDQVISTNLRSAFITARMLARHRNTNGNTAYGRIINLCSTRYLQSEAGTEAYSASKGGIYSLTHALTVSLAPMHITVNAIAPGWIHVREDEVLRSEDHEFHPSGRVGTPEDIARMCLFLCEPENDFINGQTLTIDGGATVKMIYPE